MANLPDSANREAERVRTESPMSDCLEQVAANARK
jgi:hypothetical protein